MTKGITYQEWGYVNQALTQLHRQQKKTNANNTLQAIIAHKWALRYAQGVLSVTRGASSHKPMKYDEKYTSVVLSDPSWNDEG